MPRRCAGAFAFLLERDYNSHMSKKTLLIKVLIFILFVGACTLFTVHDGFLYDRSIAKVTSVTDQYLRTKTGTDGTRNYPEKYYRQTVTGVLQNGSRRGQEIRMTNTYGKSEVYDTRYSQGDYVFVDNLKSSGGSLTGNIAGTKRDAYIIMVLSILFGLFLLTGGKRGILTIVSLVLNMLAFYWVLLLYTKGTNILAATVPMTIFFTAMLLFFMYGRSERTWISLAATLVTCAFTTAVAGIVIHFGKVDYDFMDYLITPYEQNDANMIFLSEVLVGCLGAVMDVVVTMVMTVDQIAETGLQPRRRDLVDSCRAVGDDLVGTMINLMFFTNIAACIPAFILFMRNGIAFRTIIRYNLFFELARFLTGSISIVAAIPISAFVAVWWYGRKEQEAGKETEK